MALHLRLVPKDEVANQPYETGIPYATREYFRAEWLHILAISKEVPDTAGGRGYHSPNTIQNPHKDDAEKIAEAQNAYLKRMQKIVQYINQRNKETGALPSAYILPSVELMKNWTPKTFGLSIEYSKFSGGKIVFNEITAKKYKQGSLCDVFGKIPETGISEEERGYFEGRIRLAARLLEAIRTNWTLPWNKNALLSAKTFEIPKDGEIKAYTTFEQFVTQSLATYVAEKATKDTEGRNVRAGFNGEIPQELEFFKTLHKLCFPESYEDKIEDLMQKK